MNKIKIELIIGFGKNKFIVDFDFIRVILGKWYSKDLLELIKERMEDEGVEIRK